ncbi:hypothetical protein EGR_10268 [Echinococcus granulosus]|uniref:Uncharacterized protein n=1 Tax=Echinococcus granulosus TaxID=6210 RepID=W6U187_ECHGR|nr:hypothetical protein EGR_10268 [Echinococcus granulosus]EUB54875.1 hypothetical protein EGR_10268 [Echinococcus granulosus]
MSGRRATTRRRGQHVGKREHNYTRRSRAGRQAVILRSPLPPPPPPPPPPSPTSPPISTRVEIDGQSRPAKCNGYFCQAVRTCVRVCGREFRSATVSAVCSNGAIDRRRWMRTRANTHLRTLSIEGYSKQE